MGIVRKQSIFSLIAIYAGFAVGALNTMLYIDFLSQEEYGLTSILREAFVLFSVFATLGTANTFHRFFPLYNAHLSRKDNDLPLLYFTTCTIGLIIVLACMFGFKDLVIRKFGKNSPLFVEKFYLLVPLVITFLYVNVFEAFAYMLKRTISFNLVKELGFRIVQLAIIVLFIFHIIEIDNFLVLYALMYVPSIIIMAYIVFRNNGIPLNFKISKLTKRVYKKLIGYTSFHFSGAIINIAPTAINAFLIGSISPNGLADVAVYTLAKFFISVMDAPVRSMLGINIAVISESFQQKDYNKIERIYKKTSINLLIVGIAIFTLIYANIPVVVEYFKTKDYSQVGILFLIAGLSKLVDLSMGMNWVIMYLSKFWKIEFYTSTAIILTSIPVNYILVKWQPLLGATLGEAMILILFCGVRYFWVQKLLHIKPYTFKTLGLVSIGIVCFAFAVFMPFPKNPILEVVMRTSLFALLYFILIRWYKPSEDFDDILSKVMAKFKK
jgi:O-antigen/teichoic acid export membrane protein